MASTFKTDRGAWRVSFTGLTGRRQLIHVGQKGGKRAADQVRVVVEELLDAKTGGRSPDRATALWLVNAPDAIYAKFVAAGLIDPREKTADRFLGPTYQALIDRRRGDLSNSGLEKHKQARAKMVEHFGEKRDLKTISIADARDFARWLGSKHATATASAHIRKIKAFFTDCIERRLISESPFAKIKGGTEHNAARMFYVTPATIEQVIATSADAEWRLILAIARYAALRIPSEARGMKWTDINFERGRMLVRSPKTARFGKPTRSCPIFPELLPYMQAAFEAAVDGSVYVFPAIRNGCGNMHKKIHESIERAGLSAWPKVFQNLRASGETDMCQRFPLHVACAWAGNTAAVANKHYLQVTDQHFEDAAKGVAQMTPRHASNDVNGGTGNAETPGNPRVSSDSMASAGPERTSKVLGNRPKRSSGAQKGHLAGPVPPDSSIPLEDRPDAWQQATHEFYQTLLHGGTASKAGGQ